MDVFEALYTTRAMRRMQARDIPDDVIQRILDAAIRAPSGGGFQNWAFIVIRDAEVKACLAKLFHGDVAAARRGRYRPDHLAEVPVFVAALIQSGENAIWPGGSIYPAVWSLQLAARACGLGSVPVGSLARHQDEIFPRLGVPNDGWMLASLVALGYPTGRWGVAPRRAAHEVTFVERWGQRPTWTIPKPLWPKETT
jgi:nitroreductase